MSSKPTDRKPAAKPLVKLAVSAQPRLRVLAGPNGSGKSTIQRELKPEWIGVFVNANEIERELNTSGGKLSLAKLSITDKPAAVLRRLELHIKNSNFAKKLGMHSLLGRMAIDKLLVLKCRDPTTHTLPQCWPTPYAASFYRKAKPLLLRQSCLRGTKWISCGRPGNGAIASTCTL